MEKFEMVKRALEEHVSKMVESGNLFVVDMDKDALWKLYIESFPEGTNPILRKRTEHDCSLCRHFIKTFGNVVSLTDTNVTTVWDFVVPGRYAPVVRALSEAVAARPVTDIFVSETAEVGMEKSFENAAGEAVITWEHFHVTLPGRLVRKKSTIGTTKSKARAAKEVFQRSLEEISEDSVLSVLELIAQNSLYRGEEWTGVLEAFLVHKRAYSTLCSDSAKSNYAWEKSILAGDVVSKIRNHSIGVLLVDISNNVDLDVSVRKYEAIVAPSTYKRPKPIVTKGALEEAESAIRSLGYVASLGRRYAKIEDITVNNTLFADRDAVPTLYRGDVFSEMRGQIPTNPNTFSRIEEVSISKFVEDILPCSRKVEVLLESRHYGNLVSLIAPQNHDAPGMFKWSNPISWAYEGNMADSMKTRVKSLGGDIGGVLRFSIQWNDAGDNRDDLDAHCVEPDGNEIYYMNRRHVHPSSGVLDVDIIRPEAEAPGGIAVENIAFSDLKQMPDGVYKFFVHCYSSRGARSGFTAEIEFGGQIHSFKYNQPLRQGENVQVAWVTWSRMHGFFVEEKIPSSLGVRDMWGLNSNQFHRVSVITMSPNCWDRQGGIGNRHFFFMLVGCKNPGTPNGFFNEYLNNDLLPHKRVLEVLGGKMRVEPSDNQLSGVGFSSTQRNTLVVRVTGHVNRVIRVVF